MSLKKSSCQGPTSLINWKGTDLVLEGVFLNSLFINPQCLGSLLSLCSIPSTCTELLLVAKHSAKRWWSKGTKALTLSLQTSVSLAHKHKQIITICDENYKSMNILFCHINEEPFSRASECFLGRLYWVLKDIIQCLSLAKCSAFLFLKALIHPYLRLFLIWPMMKQSNNGIVFPRINSSSLVTDTCILIGQPFCSTSLLSVFLLATVYLTDHYNFTFLSSLELVFSWYGFFHPLPTLMLFSLCIS